MYPSIPSLNGNYGAPSPLVLQAAHPSIHPSIHLLNGKYSAPSPSPSPLGPLVYGIRYRLHFRRHLSIFAECGRLSYLLFRPTVSLMSRLLPYLIYANAEKKLKMVRGSCFVFWSFSASFLGGLRFKIDLVGCGWMDGLMDG